MKLKVPFLLVLLSALSSCATYRFQPVDQEKATQDGISVHASVLTGSELRFEVTVKNASSKAVTVDSDKFRLYEGDKSDWNPVWVIPSAEYFQRVEDNARQTVMVVRTDEPVYQQTIIDNGNGTYTVTRIRRSPFYQPSTQVYVVSGNSEERLARFRASLFFAAVLDPGQTHTGFVFSEYSRAPFLKLVVPVDGKELEILFQRVKVPGPFKNLD